VSTSSQLVPAGTVEELVESSIKRAELEEAMGGQDASAAEEQASEPVVVEMPSIPPALPPREEEHDDQLDAQQATSTVQDEATGEAEPAEALAINVTATVNEAEADAATELDVDEELERVASAEDGTDATGDAGAIGPVRSPAELEAERLISEGGNVTTKQLEAVQGADEDAEKVKEAMEGAVVEPSEASDTLTAGLVPQALEDANLDARIEACRTARCSETSTAQDIAAVCITGMATSACE
jgi:hypothetical protein